MTGRYEQEALEAPDEAAQSEPQDRQIKPQDRKLKPREIGGPKGPEPTRYGDWERAGRCIDF
jgi:hypothetical protein